VLFIFENSVDQGLQDGFVYPEWQMIQYLFPALVVILQCEVDHRSQSRVAKNVTSFLDHFINSFGNNLQKEGSRSLNELFEPNWLAKNKLQNLKSLINQVQREFALLIEVKESEKEKSIMKQLVAFFDAFRWSIDVDLLKDSSGDDTTDVYFKHQGTEDFFTRTLITLRMTMRSDTTDLRSHAVGYVSTFNTVEFLLRRYLTFTRGDISVTEISQLFNVLERKLRIDLGQSKDFGRLTQDIDWKFVLQAKKLTYPQLLRVVLFHLMPLLQDCIKMSGNLSIFAQRASNLFWINAIYSLCQRGKWETLMKMIMLHMYTKRKEAQLGVIHFGLAKKLPRVYRKILGSVLSNDYGKIENLSPSTINSIWNPILVCSNCSKFECDLKICYFCKGEMCFLPPFWFCSEECEEKSLDSEHGLAHEEHLEKLLGM
jgi:hypothetical protein